MEKKRLIIENRTELSMLDALLYVKKVVEQGRISNDGMQYCYLTSFANGICVASDLNKGSDRLIVFR